MHAWLCASGGMISSHETQRGQLCQSTMPSRVMIPAAMALTRVSRRRAGSDRTTSGAGMRRPSAPQSQDHVADVELVAASQGASIGGIGRVPVGTGVLVVGAGVEHRDAAGVGRQRHRWVVCQRVAVDAA